MRHVLRRSFLVAGMVSAALLGMPQHSVIAAPTNSAPVPAPAPEGDSGSLELIGSGSSEDGTDVGTAAVCTFYSRGDNVHISSTLPRSASGHGWWDNVNCNTSTATVTIQLQQYYSDGTWRNVGAAGSATVRSGGGAGNRATGRVTCNSTAVSGWRSVIDVNLVGLLDDPGKLTTPTRNISCRW